MIRVVIVDDHAVVRRGLQQLVATADDIEVAGVAADGDEAVDVVAATEPDVVLMDLSMPGVGGVDATRRIVERRPETLVVVLTSLADSQHILAAVEAGAVGYLMKHAEPDQIIEGIRAAAAGGSPLDPKAARVVLSGARRHHVGELTDREREVLLLLRTGLPNKHIARRLDISERTVKAHLTRIYQRIGVSDRTQAALWAQEHLV